MNDSGRNSARLIAVVLFIIVGLLLFTMWESASADTLATYTLSGNSLTFSDITNGTANRGTGDFLLYSGTYPDTSTLITSTSWAPYPQSLWTANYSCTLVAGVPTCDLNNHGIPGGIFNFDVLGAGNYWLHFEDTVYAPAGAIYVPIIWTGSTFVPPQSGSGIYSISPENGSTTVSTAVSISIGYYASSTAGWDRVGYTVYNIDQNYALEASGEANATQDALSTFSEVKTLRSNGAYSLQAYLKNSATGAEIFSGSNATGADNTGDAKFAVVTNPLPGLIGTTSLAAAYLLATSTCSITNISGCFQNAIAWALYPSVDMLSAVAQGGAAVKNKPPFGYLFVNIAAIQALNASGTAPVALMALAPVTLYIFHPFDIGMASLFFFFFGVWLFLRVRHIEL